MKIVTPPLIVERDDCFKNDALDRGKFGEALLNLIKNSDDEFVISLDGKWGEGKTTFVKMWQGLLSNANVPNLYIDSFANDYIDDAFISIASAITSYAASNISKNNSDKFVELREKTKKVGGQLLKWSAKIGIKAATLGVIKDNDLEELKDIKADLAKDVSGVVADFIGERLDSYKKDIELIQSFKEILSELPSQLNNSENNPLVIIIDELDRCKPTFAVEVIEKVKHLFSVKNIIFVLVMHKEQLEESIRCVYGQNIDAHTYLQKFINLETKIPKRIEIPYSNDIYKYAARLFQLHELDTWGDQRNIIDCIEPLAIHFSLSLRQLEKIFTNLAIFYGSSTKEQDRNVPIIVFLAVIKVVDQPIFDSLSQQRISYEDLMLKTKLASFHSKEKAIERKFKWIMDWIRLVCLSDQELEELDEQDDVIKLRTSSLLYRLDRDEIIPFFSNKLNMFTVI